MGERNVDSLARALRDSPPVPDDVQQARMERRLLDASRVDRTEPEMARRRPPPFVSGVVVGLAAAAAAIVIATWGDTPVEPTGEPLAQVDALRDGLPVRSDAIAEGSTVQTTERQMLRIRFGAAANDGGTTSLVEVSASSQAVLERISGADQAIRLVRGEVRVEFHPRVRGQEGFSVRTEDARVDVVGTAFRVRSDEQGTLVSVEEGVVRVTPRGGAPRLVRAGESAEILREEVDEHATRLEDAPRSEEPEVMMPERLTTLDEPLVRRGTPAETREGVEPLAQDEDLADLEDSEPLVAIDEGPATDRLASEPLTDDLRFELAQNLFDRGQLEDARHELYAIARESPERVARGRAWTLVAETFEREPDMQRAAEAYRRAARAARGTVHASDALFALARVRGGMGDQDAARAAYLRYLEVAPDGPLAAEARRGLCRLGVSAQCPE